MATARMDLSSLVNGSKRVAGLIRHIQKVADGGTKAFEVSYGQKGPVRAPYALFVHERPPYRGATTTAEGAVGKGVVPATHRWPTKWKFLEDPMIRMERDIARFMKLLLSPILGGRGSTLLQALGVLANQVLRESQIEVPVETGRLKRTGKVTRIK